VFIILLVLCCMLWSCASPPEPPPRRSPSEAEIQPTRDALIHCYRENVARLDDGISDARTIALAVSRACWKQQKAAAEVYRPYLTPNAMAMFLEKAEARGPDLALPIVLGYRREKQQQ
jgi:hypothetical protein